MWEKGMRCRGEVLWKRNEVVGWCRGGEGGVEVDQGGAGEGALVGLDGGVWPSLGYLDL